LIEKFKNYGLNKEKRKEEKRGKEDADTDKRARIEKIMEE
jgi:hypothetical protein